MLKDDSFIYNMSNCGDNCTKWVLKIAEKKDLTVYLQHIMHFEGSFKIRIMNTGKIVCNPKEYVAGLLEAEEIEDEGSYWFKAKSKKVLFEFSIKRNINVIKGDSATGKTTLLHILYEYLRSGRQSGYSVSTNAQYYVYIRDEVGRDWKDLLYPLKKYCYFY